MKSRAKILVVDDEPGAGMIFSKILGERRYSVRHCVSVEESLPLIQSDPSIELIFLDIRLPGMDGVTALSRFFQINPALRIVMMTAYQTVESAVTAMKKGAVDYLVKPLTAEMILQAAEKYSSSAFQSYTSFFPVTEGGIASLEQDSFVAHTPTMKSILSLANQFALTDSSVLILGESGTGKELLAHHIHHRSLRNKKPFIVVDCASIPESLFEAELFGYEKGAFTGAESAKVGRFELANGGTLFLDEIGNVPMIMQAKLLRFLDDHTIMRLGGRKSITLDIRLLAATNIDLKKSVEKGTFRADLYYRLASLVIQLVPLRNRPEDERDFLIDYFLEKSAQKLKKSQPALSRPARNFLLNYSFPGNVRELQSALFSAVLLCDSNVLESQHLPLGIQSYFNNRESPSLETGERSRSLREIIKKVEREQILSAMKQTGGNKKKASEILDIDYKNFLEKLKEYSDGISNER